VFIRDYPASQAALARLRSGNPQVASRFEVYLNGMELANGFHELSDATEQAQRFNREQTRRRAAGSETVEVDDHLLTALQAGLPDCAGVALGVDRLLMCACQARHIQEVIAFPFEVA
jgi:lysyl-tRNA synthetase class 2